MAATFSTGRLLNMILTVKEFIALPIVATLFVFLLFVLYKKIRPKFPIRVNCWFCNKNSKVPYDSYNCWDCPYCQQYNGFNEDGDYNKIIEEQHTMKKPNDIKQNSIVRSNGFCKLCNINQQLKIQQLANFVAISEESYDEEIEHYQQQLEKSYRLCSSCEQVLQETLQKQYDSGLIRDGIHISNSNSLTGSHSFTAKIQIVFLGLKIIPLTVAISLIFAFLFSYETKYQILNSVLPNTFCSNLQIIFHHLKHINREVTAFGFLCYLASNFGRRSKYDYANLIFWFVVHILGWTPFFQVQFTTLIVLFVLNFQAVNGKQNYIFKKVPNKANNSENKSRVVLNEQCFSVKAEDKTHSKKRSDCLDKIESVKEEPFFTLPETSSRKSKSRISTVFNKLEKEEEEQDERKEMRETSPQPEITNNLRLLNLGTNEERNLRPSNFLFENHNFVERNKRTSFGIIRPAKFVKNSTLNSWSCGESIESISRSSTPSSGYSSQKQDKLDSSSLTSFDNFDYYQGNLFSPPPGFFPFHHPMGNSTVYNYTRPFPHPSSPSHPLHPHPHLTDFSFDSSKSSFLQSSVAEKNSKWKSTLYNASIFINFFTFLLLGYSIYSGFIFFNFSTLHFDFHK